MRLNSRWSMIIAGLVPFLSAGLLLEAPFALRALKTKNRTDIAAAVVFAFLQVAVYVAFATDDSPRSDEISNVTGATVWFCALAAAFTAGWLYRPLSKDEAMDRAARSTRPGSSYLD
ncbi:hypothetical protein [Streptomyces griseoaurantiacus]|uniref:hypothetical protein n=1 Tax=Streptomyces griseoaurantiacus TaxID=68213 RepID=UPI0036981AFC